MGQHVRPRAEAARRRNGLAWGAAFLLLAGLGGGALHSAGAPSATILGAEFLPVDLDGNGLYNYLNVTVTVQPPSNGSYLLSATLRWPTTGTTVAQASAFVSLPGGTLSRYTLTIDGPKIADKQLNGPFDLAVDLLSSPAGPVNDTASFTTGPLRADQFERSSDEDKPRIDVEDREIRLSTPALNASVNLSSPAVRWATAGPAGELRAFEATFARLVAFADDGDRAYESGELACEALLGATNWSILSLEIGPSNATQDYGSYVRFSLGSPITFASAACPAAPSGRLELTFLLTQRNTTTGGSTPFPIRGGLDIKVDMELSLEAAAPASDVAFEMGLRDTGANASFLVRGPKGYETLPSGKDTSGVQPLVPAVTGDLVERVAFVDGGGVERGHFLWLTLASQALAGGGERFVQVKASQQVQGGAMRLFLAVPSDGPMRKVLLDPALGVPAPAPTLPQGGPAPAPPRPEPASPTVFAAALAAVSAIFLFSVYARAKKY